MGFAVSARDSGGTELRPPAANLADLVRAAQVRVRKIDAELADVQTRVSAAVAAAARGDSAVAAAQHAVEPLRAPAGLEAVTGPGIVVILDDASEQPAGIFVDPNQLVIHQSDLQSVVNALWAGGAEAMTIAGQRIVATSAVRCVGNTLLLNGEVYSPPYRVAAVGPYKTMQKALDTAPGVKLFRQAADYYGLGYTVEQSSALKLPAYRGSLSLAHARAGTR